ncbi:5368_t:CDS:2 [Funneliformis geosporum]|nr:5368_t:CDS:2 [Funneliformis geosporum]
MARMQIYDEMELYLSGKKREYLRKMTQKAKNIYTLFKEIEIDKIGVVTSSADAISRLTDAQIQNIISLYTDELTKSQKLISVNNFKWSTNETKQRVYEGFKNISGMKNVIGAIDGSHIVLANVLLKQPETYWSRKKRYSIQLQRIVDHKGIFIDYEIGWSGSVHDARVYKNSHFYLNASEIIKGNEFLLEDSAYPISTFVIKPFTNS